MCFWAFIKKIKKVLENLLTKEEIGGILDELSLEDEFEKQLKNFLKKLKKDVDK